MNFLPSPTSNWPFYKEEGKEEEGEEEKEEGEEEEEEERRGEEEGRRGKREGGRGGRGEGGLTQCNVIIHQTMALLHSCTLSACVYSDAHIYCNMLG